MVPALNAYGRYVQSTAFAALDAGILRRAVPLVVREGVNYHSAGNLASNEPSDRYTYGNLSANLVGVLNKSFSYRFEQSLYENNVGGGSTGHFWIAYNQLLHGDGHLIVGKVDAPAPPAFSYWHDASAFSSPEIAVGQHGYLLDGTRWGVGFNYVPKNYVKQPYKVQLAYLGNAPSLYNPSVFSNSNPYAPDQSGSDRAFQYKAAFARPDQPIEAGVYGAVGSYILANGYAHPSDAYRATGVYAQRDPVGHVPGVLVFYQQTYDANVGPGDGSTPLVQSATSRAFALELSESFLHGDVMLAVRPVEYLSGLQDRQRDSTRRGRHNRITARSTSSRGIRSSRRTSTSYSNRGSVRLRTHGTRNRHGPRKSGGPLRSSARRLSRGYRRACVQSQSPTRRRPRARARASTRRMHRRRPRPCRPARRSS